MKIKSIAVACLALCASSAFAQLNPNTAATYTTYYMGGATAQLPGAAIVVPANMFNPSTPVTWIYQGSASNPNPAGTVAFPSNPNPSTASNGNNVIAWYGVAAAATGVTGNLLVIYNQNAGSMTGLAQLLNTMGSAPTAFPASWTKVLTVGQGSNLFTCQTVTPTGGVPTNTCYTNSNYVAATYDAYTPMSLALSDVYAVENAGVLTPGQNGFAALSSLTQVTTGLEGFGIAVNPALYLALQKAQGLVPETATLPVLGGAYQPSVSRTDYASLVSQLGNANIQASDFVQDPNNTSDNTPIYIERRTNWSGTQSASDMFFLNAICNGGAGTFLAPLDLGPETGSAGPTLAVGGTLTYLTENASTGGVKNAMTWGNAAAVPQGSYAIGIVSLENTPSQAAPTATTGSWQFVKLDGVSPDWINNAGVYTYDSTHRASTISGAYKFAVEMNAYYKASNVTATKDMDALIVAELSNSSLHNLTGVSYLDGLTNGSANQAYQARYSHYGSNCAPMFNQYY